MEVSRQPDAVRPRRPSLLPAWRHAYAGELMARSAACGSAAPGTQKVRRTDTVRPLIPLAADEDLDNRIVRGVLRKEPGVDMVRIQDAGLSGHDDPEVLRWAAGEGRVLFSHDANTMTLHAWTRVKTGLAMPGLYVVRRNRSLGVIIEDICLIATLSEAGEHETRVGYVPLGRGDATSG